MDLENSDSTAMTHINTSNEEQVTFAHFTTQKQKGGFFLD
jgi:hypothetical protein